MVKFKEFKVGDLLDGYIGTFISDEFRKEKKDSEFNIPLITSQTTNNGIQAYVKAGEYRELEDCLSISKDGIYAGTVFYQKGKFTLGNVAMGIFAKDLYEEYFTKNVYLYLASHIEKIAKSFGGYSKKVGWNIFEYTISLPVTHDGSPDYAYMEDYIKGIQRQYIDNLLETNEAERNRLLSIVGLSLDEYERVKGNIELCAAKSYGEFKVGDLFEITNGGRVTKQDQVEGTIPYVTATTENNGIESYISNPKFTKKDLITVSFFGDVYYHPYEIGFKDGTYGLDLLGKRSKYIYLFLTSVLHKRFKGQGSYSQMLTGNAMYEMHIKLPTTLTGEVDYAYMEDYISKIKLIYIYNRELSVNEQVRLLESLIFVSELVEPN